jgi:LPS sulfotransferase NodH
MQLEPVTPNGVWGAKMMWNYLADAVDRLRAWPRLDVAKDAADAEVLAAAFPGLHYVWLHRKDKLRQAISWWRAAETGQYALAPGQVPADPPDYDRDAIGRLLRYAEDCEAGWREWFTTNSVRPTELVYEDLIEDVGSAVRAVAQAMHVTLPRALEPVPPRLRRQADHHTERMVKLFSQPGEA